MPIHGYLGGVISATAPSVTTAGASGVFTLEEQLQASAQNNWPGYQISRSLRFRASATAYFNRTYGVATNNQKGTISVWLKQGLLNQRNTIFASTTGAIGILIGATAGACNLQLLGSGLAGNGTTQVFRDPGAWFHLVVAVDTTQATGSDRIKAYINNTAITLPDTATQNAAFFTDSIVYRIGNYANSSGFYYDGYMAEFYFVDGQQLTPSSFGVTDSVTGVWNPIRYSGTYGNNGSYLNFSDPTSTTTIGYDYSGNSNNWTANNISVTAGTTYDSMVDVPIGYGSDTGVGGEVRGNYATFNPIDVSPSSTAQTITQGNLSLFSSSATRIDGAYSTMAVTSGKWYVELTCTTRTADYPTAGWCSTSFNTNGSGFQWQAGNPNNTKGASLDPGGAININGATTASNYYGTTWSTGNVIQVAVDIDNKLIWFGKAGSWTGTAGNMDGNPATGTNGASFSGQGGTEWKFQSCVGDNDRGDVNFGQRAFSYTAPSGFKALCTQNLPTATIDNGANYMAASIWDGNQTARTITNTVNGISFQPDFIWTKSRSNVESHRLSDSVRGSNGTVLYTLLSNDSAAEGADTDSTGFVSTGFTIRAGSNTPNITGRTYVGWQWKASGSTVSNTAGSITSTVSANTAAGFSILTYTGTGATATIGHGLGAVPSMMIMKKRSNAGSWKVYHTVLGNTKILEMNAVDGAQTSSTYWNNTSPTSTLITVGSNGDINASGETYVSYCWTAITGYSAFTTYTGNGSGDGPFVYCGFRPRWLMIKRYDTTGDPWWVIDSTRSPYNQTTLALRPNSSNAEDSGGNANFDFLANGFKARTSGGGNGNESGATYIVAAFAENPFNISRAR
jgi:hypothetical protein